MVDHACTGIDCKIRDKCQRYVLHLKAKASASQGENQWYMGVNQWYVIPGDPKDCSYFVEKHNAEPIQEKAKTKATSQSNRDPQANKRSRSRNNSPTTENG